MRMSGRVLGEAKKERFGFCKLGLWRRRPCLDGTFITDICNLITTPHSWPPVASYSENNYMMEHTTLRHL